MRDLQIGDLPASLHQLLAERARRQRRTIAQQARVILEDALSVRSHKELRRALLAEIGRRKRFDFSRIPSPEQLVREDRDR